MVDSQIRLATADDHQLLLPIWLGLAKELANAHSRPFGDFIPEQRLPLLQQMLDNCLQNEQSTVLWIGENECIATLAVVLNLQTGFSQPNSGVMFNLWVDPTHRRQGLASEMVEAAICWLKQQGASSVQVGWHPENQAADKFWRNLGFTNYEVIAAKKLDG